MKRRSRAALFAIALTPILALCGTPANAQDDPRKAQAQALFEEGVKLHNGDHEAEALERFEKSHAILPAVNSLYWVAREEQLLGRGLDALRHYREALKNPLLSPKTSELAKQFVTELEPRFGRVSFVGPSGTRVEVDGKELRLPLDQPFDVAPGSITARGDHDGKKYVGSVMAVAGSTTILELNPIDGAKLPTTEPPSEPAADASFWGWRSIGGLVVLGAGAVAIGVGIAAKSEQSSKDDSVARLATALPPGDPGTRCFNSTTQACVEYQDARSARDSAQSRANTWLPIGIGAALVGGGFIASALIWPHRRASSPTAGATNPRLVPVTDRRSAGFLFISDF